MEGTDVIKTPSHDIVKLGVAHVPEHRRLFPRMSVEDNLRMGAFSPQFRANYQNRLNFVYSLFPKMQERRNQYAGTMSGGEQQMCAIGRALMSKPETILLDEPSMGLAPQLVEEIFGIVKDLNEKEGVSFLLACTRKATRKVAVPKGRSDHPAPGTRQTQIQIKITTKSLQYHTKIIPK